MPADAASSSARTSLGPTTATLGRYRWSWPADGAATAASTNKVDPSVVARRRDTCGPLSFHRERRPLKPPPRLRGGEPTRIADKRQGGKGRAMERWATGRISRIVARMRRVAFAFVFITVLLDMLAFGIIVPVLPQLVVTLGGGDTASGAAIFGVFGTVFAAAQFFSAPVLGALADRFGRRPVILLSNLGLGVDYIVMSLAPTIAILFVGRLISGVTSSSFSTAGAYIADVTPPEKRAARFGMLGVAFGVGFIIGPAVGGLLGAIDLRAPFWAAAALSFANFAYGFFILPESLPRESRAPFRPRAANPIGAMRFLGSKPILTSLALAAFLAYIAHDVLPATAVLYMNYRYAFDERAVGLVLAVAGASSIVVQGAVVGRVVAA